MRDIVAGEELTWDYGNLFDKVAFIKKNSELTEMKSNVEDIIMFSAFYYFRKLSISVPLLVRWNQKKT